MQLVQTCSNNGNYRAPADFILFGEATYRACTLLSNKSMGHAVRDQITASLPSNATDRATYWPGQLYPSLARICLKQKASTLTSAESRLQKHYSALSIITVRASWLVLYNLGASKSSNGPISSLHRCHVGAKSMRSGIKIAVSASRLQRLHICTRLNALIAAQHPATMRVPMSTSAGTCK